jgi:uncharacterized damage-inducible protein DinB
VRDLNPKEADVKPDDAKTIGTFLLDTLEAEIPITVGVFAAVPENRLDYRPDGLSKTALDLVRHITLEDEWFLNAIIEGRFSSRPDQSDACGLMKPADCAAKYPGRMSTAISRVREMSGDELARQLDMFGFIQMPAVGFLSLLIRHSAHHRGQLSAYLRAMGGKVPSIYGPSADTANAPA